MTASQMLAWGAGPRKAVWRRTNVHNDTITCPIMGPQHDTGAYRGGCNFRVGIILQEKIVFKEGGNIFPWQNLP